LVALGFGRLLFRLTSEPARAFGFEVFPSGKEAEQITVNDGAKFLSAAAEIPQTMLGENCRFLQTALPLQAVKRGQGNAKATVQVTQGFKQMGFELRVIYLSLRAFGLRVGAAALRLRQRIGAFSFVGSHRYLLYR
jgi:hypothetical protein